MRLLIVFVLFASCANAGTLTIMTTSCPGGTQYAAYSGCTISVTGGTPPYTFSVDSSTTYSTLPPGMTLNGSAGAISGSLIGGQGNYVAGIIVTDSVSDRVEQAISFAITGNNSFLANIFPSNSIFHHRVDAATTGLPVDTSPAAPIYSGYKSESLKVYFGNTNGGNFPNGIPAIEVPYNQPDVSVTTVANGYQSYFTSGPIPAYAPIEGTANNVNLTNYIGDGHVPVYLEGGDGNPPALYELYEGVLQNGGGWDDASNALWSDVTSNALTPQGNGTTDAAGLPVSPLLVNADEVIGTGSPSSPNGTIKHPIRFTLEHGLNYWVWPATQSAGLGYCSNGGSSIPVENQISQSSPPTSCSFSGPFGEIYRLMASVPTPSCATTSPQANIIIAAFRNYGIIMADNGNSGGLIGTPDTRWNDSDLACLTSITLGDFEPVNVSSLIISNDSGQTPGGNSVLTTTKTHTGNFSQGQQNAAYSVTVSNAVSAPATSGTVTVTEAVPSGLALVSMAGTGWTCGPATCTRGDVLNGGSSYPPITVMVNVANNATSPQLNQISVSGGGSATASATDSTNITSTPASVTTTSGAPQSAAINTAFAIPLEVTVTDANGSPISGIAIIFTAPSSGASGTFTGGGSTTTATTNAQGVAVAPAFTADGIAGGPYIVTATVTGVATPANFSLTNSASGTLPPSTPSAVSATTGTPQTTVTNTAFATPLQAKVSDANGNPISGIAVIFTAPSSGASGTFAGGVSTVSATTNTQGLATAPVFTANGIAGGPYTVIATASGVAAPANFSLTNASAAFTLQSTSGSGQSIVPGQTASFSFTISSVLIPNETVGLSCSVAPSQATCSLSPASLPLSGAAQQFTASVATTADTSGRLIVFNHRGRFTFSFLAALVLAVMSVPFAAGAGKRDNRSLIRSVSLCTIVFFAIALVAGMAACGSANSNANTSTASTGTPSGSYTLTITATPSVTGGPAQMIGVSFSVQ
jgi:hypothetical protein